MNQRMWIVLMVGSLLAIGCSQNRSGASEGCVPGTTQVCLCVGQQGGVQSCNDAGTGFLPCECLGPGDLNFPDVDAPDIDAMLSDAGSDGLGTGTSGSEDVMSSVDTSSEQVDGFSTSDSSSNTGEETGEGSGGSAGPDGNLGADDGSSPTEYSCVQDTDCPSDLPNCAPQGVCIFCYPGTYQCNGDISEICADDASAWVVSENCGVAGGFCNSVGVCQSECGGFGKLAGTNVGCEFWAVDLRNAQVSTPAKYLDAQNAPFVLVVSNTEETASVDVEVTSPNGYVQAASVPPGGLLTFPVDSSYGLTGTGRFDAGIHIVTSGPVAAFQFNPYSNADVFSNDASTLLPADAQGGTYRVISMPHSNLGGGNEFPGYFVVVGADTSSVPVTVTPTSTVEGGGEIPTITGGTSYDFVVAPGEVMAFESANGDLTGSLVDAAGRVMVYSGHVAARPDTECCSDHLEQQIPPISTWGTKYAAYRYWPRPMDYDYVKVVASENNTNVTLTINGVGQVISLSAGQHYMTTFSETLYVTADKPVLVAQLMASANEGVVQGPCNTPADCGGNAYKCEPFSSSSSVDVCLLNSCTQDSDCGPGFACAASLYGEPGKECKPIGDPAMSLLVPTDYWQERFVFVAPDKYKEDYVNIVTQSGVTVTLDGNSVTDFTPVSGGYVAAQLLISDGVHIIDATGPASVTVYGYDDHVSYAYPAGARLQ